MDPSTGPAFAGLAFLKSGSTSLPLIWYRGLSSLPTPKSCTRTLHDPPFTFIILNCDRCSAGGVNGDRITLNLVGGSEVDAEAIVSSDTFGEVTIGGVNSVAIQPNLGSNEVETIDTSDAIGKGDGFNRGGN